MLGPLRAKQTPFFFNAVFQKKEKVREQLHCNATKGGLVKHPYLLRIIKDARSKTKARGPLWGHPYLLRIIKDARSKTKAAPTHTHRHMCVFRGPCGGTPTCYA